MSETPAQSATEIDVGDGRKAPLHDGRGKFAKGNPGGRMREGRPNRSARGMKDMVLGGLERLGGDAWWEQFGRAHPEAFAEICARLLPREQQISAAVLNTSDPDQVPIEVSDMFFTLLHQVEIETKLEREAGARALPSAMPQAAQPAAVILDKFDDELAP